MKDRSVRRCPGARTHKKNLDSVHEHSKFRLQESDDEIPPTLRTTQHSAGPFFGEALVGSFFPLCLFGRFSSLKLVEGNELDQISTWNLVKHVNAILGLVDKSLSEVIFPYFNALQFCCLTYWSVHTYLLPIGA